MPVFHDREMANAHDEFQKWRAENEDGFFLNWISPNNIMLHRVQCPHFGETDWTIKERKGWGNLGNTKKI